VKTRWLARAELAVITLRAESDELVVDVEVERPAVAVGGQPDVATLDTGGGQCDPRLRRNESTRGSRKG
jgi:hypothetical protein